MFSSVVGSETTTRVQRERWPSDVAPIHERFTTTDMVRRLHRGLLRGCFPSKSSRKSTRRLLLNAQADVPGGGHLRWCVAASTGSKSEVFNRKIATRHASLCAKPNAESSISLTDSMRK